MGSVISFEPRRPDIDFDTRYLLMTTEQVPPQEMATWLHDPAFKTYVEEKRAEFSHGRALQRREKFELVP